MSHDFEQNLALMTIYTSHYNRMKAVIDAAQSKNKLLLKLALEFYWRHGDNDVDDDGKPIEHRPAVPRNPMGYYHPELATAKSEPA